MQLAPTPTASHATPGAHPAPSTRMAAEYRSDLIALGATKVEARSADEVVATFGTGIDYVLANAGLRDSVDGVRLTLTTTAPVPRLMPNTRQVVEALGQLDGINGKLIRDDNGDGRNTVTIFTRTDARSEQLRALLSPRLPSGDEVVVQWGISAD